MSAPSAPLRGIVFAIAATILMGAMFPVMTDALAHIDPFTFTSLRYLIAGAFFLALLLKREGVAALDLTRGQVWRGWLLGSVGFCGFGSFVFLGQQLAGREGALTASIMMATQPMMGLLLNAALSRKPPRIVSLCFVLLSFFGGILVVTKGDVAALLHEPQNFTADGLIVFGALCWVIYSFGATGFKHWSALKYTTVTVWLSLITIIGLNIVLLASRALSVPSTGDLRAILPNLLYMGPVAGFLAILMWNLANKILTPTNAVLFMDIVPLTAFTVSSLTGVVPTAAQIVGGAVTGGALILNNLYLRRGKVIER
jgi:drug/metabolite transporter (DMT)-like permease